MSVPLVQVTLYGITIAAKEDVDITGKIAITEMALKLDPFLAQATHLVSLFDTLGRKRQREWIERRTLPTVGPRARQV